MSEHSQSMDGKVVLLTGGGGLLGKSHTEALIRAGAHVAVCDLDASAASRVAAPHEREGRAFAVTMDVSSRESVVDAVGSIVDTFGRLDVVVNNAALDPKVGPNETGLSTRFEDLPIDEWNRSLAVNVSGAFLVCQAALPVLREAPRGTIINIASTYGIVGPDQRIYQVEGRRPQFKPVTYTVSKAAIIGLTRYLATYLAGTSVRVNTLSPGGVLASQDDEFIARYSDRVVMGRMAMAEEISNVLVFLASDASSYMTGANVVVDGGWTAW